MSQEWTIDGPRVLDIGDEGERVTSLLVAVVGGRVAVVTHDDSPTARLEVTSLEGLPLRVSWNGSALKVVHGKDSDPHVLDMLRRTVENFSRAKVVLSLSVPEDATANVTTVSATALVSGLRASVHANTVSGSMTLTDLEGDLDLNTVSGDVECTDMRGPLKVNSVSGGVTVQAGALPTVKIKTVSGDIALDLTSGTSDITSHSVSGDVTVRAPLSGYDVEANTASGQVVVDGKKVGNSGWGGHGPDHGGRIREGDGAMRIKANAVSGNVVVLRAGTSAPTSGAEVPQDAPSPQDAPLHESASPNHPTDTTAIPHPETTQLPQHLEPESPDTEQHPASPEPPGHPQDHPRGWGDDRPAAG